MSLWPAFLKAKRTDDAAPTPEPVTQPAPDAPADGPKDPVFDLVPPEPPAKEEPAAEDVKPVAAEEPSAPAAPERPDVHTIGITDSGRLAVDREGLLYWDGKPVELHRRITMSPAQVLSALVIGAFVVIGALGAAIHGTAAALDWACRLGWTTSYCSQPEQPPPRLDIPA